MSDYEIECIECGWSGTASELHCSEEDESSDKEVDDIAFDCCPDCSAKDCFEDIEEGE